MAFFGTELSVPVKEAVMCTDQLTIRRSMKTKASKKHPNEYKKARERYPSPEY